MKRILVLFLCGFLLGLISIFVFKGIYLPKDSSSIEEKIFSVEKGWGTKEISINLEKQGLIKYGPLFRIYVLTKGISLQLQAGDYLLSPSMNIPEIVQKMVSGDVYKIKITIPEGFTITEIDKRLSGAGLIQEGEILDTGLEGFLFPDTYYFSLNMSPEEIIKVFLDNFNKKLAPYRNEISGSGLTISQIVIMASLIEKEVRTIEDKKLVSGILWKRLKVNMPLQVDAAMETYEHKGLPAFSICNPGLDSILAAVYPKSSEYWYYLSTPEGETIFSKTLKEHESNIKEYYD